MCPRRLDHEFRGEFGSDDPVNRGRVRGAFLDAARTAHTLTVPLADAPWRFPPGLEPEETAVVEQAVHWYVNLFRDRKVTLHDHDLDRPSEVLGIGERLGGWVDLTVVGADGQRELRQLDFWAGKIPDDPLDHWGVRLALLRLDDWIAGEPILVSWTDLLHGVRRERLVDPTDVGPEVRADLDDRVAVIRDRTVRPEPVPSADCATCKFRKGCTEFPKAITVRTRRGSRLPAVMSITPSSVEAWHRCRRMWHSQHLLSVPASDGSTPGAHGLQVHDLLRHLHRDGPCDDPARIDEIVDAHGDDARVRAELHSHARRCPSGAKTYGHEFTRSRLFARYPNFLASARIDAAWLHDGILDLRDYKTGGSWYTRVADDPRARLQAWVMAPIAAERGIQLRLRYEHLATEINDDPDEWEPDADDLVAVQDELMDLVNSIRAAEGTENGWVGVADAEVCRTCRYRSICPDSALPGVAGWPRVDDDGLDVDPAADEEWA